MTKGNPVSFCGRSGEVVGKDPDTLFREATIPDATFAFLYADDLNFFGRGDVQSPPLLDRGQICSHCSDDASGVGLDLAEYLVQLLLRHAGVSEGVLQLLDKDLKVPNLRRLNFELRHDIVDIRQTDRPLSG